MATSTVLYPSILEEGLCNLDVPPPETNFRRERGAQVASNLVKWSSRRRRKKLLKWESATIAREKDSISQLLIPPCLAFEWRPKSEIIGALEVKWTFSGVSHSRSPSLQKGPFAAELPVKREWKWITWVVGTWRATGKMDVGIWVWKKGWSKLKKA